MPDDRRALEMEQTLQDRIRERAYHFWSNGSGQGDDNDYWLMAEREVLGEIAAKSPLASASLETAKPVPSVPAETAAPRKARASTKSGSRTQAKPTLTASIKTRVRAAGR
jgi:Protein of unknown function (DUF2934)